MLAHTAEQLAPQGRSQKALHGVPSGHARGPAHAFRPEGAAVLSLVPRLAGPEPLDERFWAESVAASLMRLLLTAIPAPAAFCFLVRPGEPHRTPVGAQSLEGSVRPVSPAALRSALPGLEHEVGVARLVERRGGPAGAGAGWHEDWLADQDQALAISFDLDPSTRVCAGLARGPEGAGFALEDRARLESLVPLARHQAALELRCSELERRELVLLALRELGDACCVVDRDSGRILWTYDVGRGGAYACAPDDEERLAALITHLHAVERAADDTTLHTVDGATSVARVADLGTPAAFGRRPCLAAALVNTRALPVKLSNRERAIAQLLVRGYTTLNAAAILGLSEHTVRTYVRRLYRKLEVTNRADLVGRCRNLHIV